MKNSLENKLSKSLLLAVFTSLSLIFGNLSLSVKANTPAKNQNSNITNTEITNYAQSVLKMEPKRQKAFEAIKEIIGGKEIPKIVCNDPQSMNNLPDQAKVIVVKYCNDSQNIVSEHSLTIDRFNQITVELQNNSDLKSKIYNTLIRLQNEANEAAAKAGARNGR